MADHYIQGTWSNIGNCSYWRSCLRRGDVSKAVFGNVQVDNGVTEDQIGSCVTNFSATMKQGRMG